MGVPTKDDPYYAALRAEWERLEDEQRQRYERALSEFVKAAKPLWGRGDGFGGMVMNDLYRAQITAGLPVLRYGPWETVRAEFAKRRRSLRRVIVARDGELCDACGRTDRLQIDHKIPVCLGGSNHPDNLHLLCADCNSAKGTMTWATFMTDLMVGAE